jgi:hypothetical protein
MSLKRKITFSLGFLLLLAFLLLGLLTGAYLYLPTYIESKILPQIAAETGISDVAVKIRNLGFFSADLGNIRIGPKQNPTLLIRSVQVDYSPKGLYNKKIRKLTLNGIELYGDVKNGNVSLQGFDLSQRQRPENPPETTSSPSGPSPAQMSLGSLEIRNSVVILNIENRQYRMLFESHVVFENTSGNSIKAATTLYPRGQAVHTHAEIDLSHHRIDLKLDAKALNLDRFSDLSQTVEGLGFTGQADIKGAVQLQWAPFQITSINATMALWQSKINFENFQLQNSRNAHQEEIPLRINIAGSGINRLTLNAFDVAVTSPLPMTLSSIQVGINLTGKNVESTGDMAVVLKPTATTKNISLPIEVLNEFPLSATFSVQYDQEERLRFRLKSTPENNPASKGVRLQYDHYKIASTLPIIEIAGKGKVDRIQADYTIKIKDVHIASPGETVQMPLLVLKGSAHFNQNSNGGAAATFDLGSPKTLVKLEDTTLKINKFTVSGKIKTDKNGDSNVNGLLKFADSTLHDPKREVSINRIRGTIPFEWPPKNMEKMGKKGKKGSFAVGALWHKRSNLGQIKGDIRQTRAGFAFKGQHISKLFPEMATHFNGAAKLLPGEPPAGNIHFELSRPANTADIDLGLLLAAGSGITVNGDFNLSGNLAMEGADFSGSIHSQLKNGKLSIPESKISVEGIQMSISMPELPQIRSAPRQQIRFNKITLGDLIAQDATIDFRIESPQSIFIEKARFIWCDGKVDTQSMRISPGIEDYRVIFYCDRLNLAKVLEQFGAATVEGKGAVSGRIPLHYQNGNLSFDDGFLFSTPGESGKVHLTATQSLTAGMEPDTPQFVQMDLAGKALEDYDYSWVKLNITSEGEDLLLQMQMDGKPAKALPFIYKKETGGFVKAGVGSKGSRFQGIRLDVNFKLPLNHLLRYKNIVDKFQ